MKIQASILAAVFAMCLSSAHCGAQGIPAVTNVSVLSTSPDNGTVPYNTGTVTIRIVGSGFSTVAGANGVRLDDLDGFNDPARTAATNYTVDSDTQITATFPAGIRTRGAVGWNVIVTNSAGANTTSAEKFVPRAGLLISEIFIGKTGASDCEFVEVYNPTANRLNASTLGFRLHTLNATGGDSAKGLTKVTDCDIPAHGYMLLVSTAATNESWSTHRDYIYSTGSPALVGNGGAYISLSSTPDVKVLDKVGWGTQPVPGFEGVRLANISSDYSVERKPAGGWGHATDTDTNANDFLSASTNISPRGSADPLQPPPPASIVIARESLQFADDHFLMDGTAASNLTLSVRCSPDLSAPFTIIGTATADETGAFDYDDADTDSVEKRYYRVTYP